MTPIVAALTRTSIFCTGPEPARTSSNSGSATLARRSGIGPRRLERSDRRYGAPLLYLLLTLVLPCTSFAMEIRRVQTCSGTVLKLRGDVMEGDYLRLRAHFKKKDVIVGLELSSYGGDFEEGLRIADLAHHEKLTVYVSDECDSACADIFFAAEKRFFDSNSKIGVHSISNEREVEDAESRLMTMKLARLWAKRGVPNSAIGKMVITRPDAISYLDQADLLALDASAGNPFAYKSGETEQSQQQVCAAHAGDKSTLIASSPAGTATKNVGRR
jgi:hypothetical protein